MPSVEKRLVFALGFDLSAMPKASFPPSFGKPPGQVFVNLINVRRSCPGKGSHHLRLSDPHSLFGSAASRPWLLYYLSSPVLFMKI